MKGVWVPRVDGADARVAVVGMAVTYADCSNKDQFWQVVSSGKVTSRDVPAERLDVINKQMHFMKARSKYSDTFCNDRYSFIDINPEVNPTRTEHDFLLSLARDALKDHAQRAESNKGINLKASRVGIISGSLNFPRDNTQGEYSMLYQSHMESKFPEYIADQAPWTNRAESMNPTKNEQLQYRSDPASYVAEKLGLTHNPVSYAIDAACATSLYVMRLAQEHLVKGECDVMLCGATTLNDPMFILSGFSTFQALPVKGTKDDISAPWRKGSTGLTPGEGGCVLVMKRLQDAISDGDHIYGTMLACGINNAGTGLPLKPLLDSELSCLRETYCLIDHYYANQDIKAKHVDYVECHATGTSQGDQVELDSMKICYKERGQELPLFGSAKGNFGHTLVAAGFAGTCKMLLAMEKGLLPPTPALEGQAMHENVVDKLLPWVSMNSGNIKMAGVSAFGFGGTNAHAVFMKCENRKDYLSKSQPVPVANVSKEVAVIGMDCIFGDAKTLEEFEQKIYNQTPIKRSLPNSRWRFLTNDRTFNETIFGEFKDNIQAGFLDSFDVDFKALKTPVTSEDLLIPQQLVCLTVMDNAVKQSNIPKGSRTAVLVGLGLELELHKHKGRVLFKERLNPVIVNDKKYKAQLDKMVDYVQDTGTSTSYTSYIGNLVATRLASLHGFTGPSFTITEGENSATRAMQVAKNLLESDCVDYAVIGGVDLNCSAEAFYNKSRNYIFSDSTMWLGEGAGAIIVSSKDVASANKHIIYANICGIGCARNDVFQSIQLAHEQYARDVVPDMIELSAVPRRKYVTKEAFIDMEDEVTALADYYGLKGWKQICLTTNSEIIGRCGYATGIAGILKAVLCLYNRYLPASFDGSKPGVEDSLGAIARSVLTKKSDLSDTKFFLPKKSIPWVRNHDRADEISDRRFAGVSTVAESNSCIYILLKDECLSHESQNLLSLDKTQLRLYLLHADNIEKLLNKLSQLIPSGGDVDAKQLFRALLTETIANESKASNVIFSLVCDESLESLQEEVDAALKRIPMCITSKKDFRSKRGSFLAIMPSKSNRICTMFAEGRAPYYGFTRQLYRIWPGLHEVTQEWTTDMWPSGSNEEFHPRELSVEDYAAADKEFEDNQIRKFRSGCFHSMQTTNFALCQLGIAPKASCGLSLGELSQYFAFSKHNCSVSNDITERLGSSYVWREAMGGKLEAIRVFLRNKGSKVADLPNFDDVWFGYILPKSREEIVVAMEDLGPSVTDFLRLMIINDADSALVSGTHEALEILIAKLGLNKRLVLPVPQRLIGHCKEVGPHLQDIASIHEALEIPDRAKEGLTLYTNIGFCPVSEVSYKTMGELAGRIYLEEANFVKLIERIYSDGFDVFIELGADSQRSQAVKSIMKKKFNKEESEYVTVAIDKRDVEMWDSVVRMLAVLKSNQIPGVTLKNVYHTKLLEPIEVPHKMIKSISMNFKFNQIFASDLAEIPKSKPIRARNMVRIAFDRAQAEQLWKTKDAAPSRIEPIPLKTITKPILTNGNHCNVSMGNDDVETLKVFDFSVEAIGKFANEFSSTCRLSENIILPPFTPADFGSQGFQRDYDVDYSIYLGPMWSGLAGVDFVVNAAKSRILACYGTLNLSIDQIKSDLQHIIARLNGSTNAFAVNITHLPFNPEREMQLFELITGLNIQIIEISRYTSITPELLKFRLVNPRAKIIAKVYRSDVAALFMKNISDVVALNKVAVLKLIHQGQLPFDASTSASQQPFANDIACMGSNAELTVLQVCNTLRKTHHSHSRIGVAGNIGCSQAIFTAFTAGADFVVTGSINLLSKESRLSNKVKQLILAADSTDVAKIPAFSLNMFDQTDESEIPILKKGTMFVSKANKIYELFQKHNSWSDIPDGERQKIEAKMLKMTFEQKWQELRKEMEQDPIEAKRLKDFDLKAVEEQKRIWLALVFADILKQGVSNGMENGVPSDAMVWTSSAVGAFNVLHPDLALKPVAEITKQLILGACRLKRVHDLRQALQYVNVKSNVLDMF